MSRTIKACLTVLVFTLGLGLVVVFGLMVLMVIPRSAVLPIIGCCIVITVILIRMEV